jgi:hypothetical protein
MRKGLRRLISLRPYGVPRKMRPDKNRQDRRDRKAGIPSGYDVLRDRLPAAPYVDASRMAAGGRLG